MKEDDAKQFRRQVSRIKSFGSNG